MQSRLKLLQYICHYGNRRGLDKCTTDVRFLSQGSSLLSSSFVAESRQADDSPHATESPELPDWVKSASLAGSAANEVNEDDDFVLPSLTNWIVGYRTHPTGVDLERETGDLLNTEVDQIGKVLKNKFESLDAVVESLTSCGVEVTDNLVRQILQRFSCEWVPCLGFSKWAKSQRGFQFSPELYNLMVDVMGKSRKFDRMFELVEEMKQLDGYITRDTMIKVIRRLAKAGKFDEAITVFRGLEQFGLSKDINNLNILIHALIKNQGIELAEKVYLEFKDIIPPNVYTFNILAHGWCKIRKLKKAKETVEEMKRFGFNPDAVTCTSFIEAHCREKDFRKVEDMLKYMEKNGLVPSVTTYTIMITAFGKAKEINRALEAYEKMKKQGCIPDSELYGALIQALSRSGRWKDARELFEDMGKQGVNPDRLAYNTMIAAAVFDSREEDALMLLKRMEESRCKPNIETYTPLLKMCCKLKRMKVLSFLLSHMFSNNVSLTFGTYDLLITGLCRSGHVDRACTLFEELVHKGFAPTDSMYGKLLKGLEKKGLNKEIRKIKELMQRAKQRASVDSRKSFVQVQE
ncbi:OLC1v1019982C1 [Oldenlandia corymbosa var. corymbosa]|uniref:OLC1v1019982C1 n=1 Tax=Oldenlandia corymbosa var. corymbosa TaxID=529605 RepID=A0AAV1EFG2_OLDCO|nr:OLC1v1019982C1 [Oldenlandia corymbosa var. corymbosa]